jgi:two-component system NarL family sensor kinase
MKLLLIAFMAFAGLVSVAQSNSDKEVDSLINRINTISKGTARVDEMVLVGLLLRKNDMKKAHQYADMALAESRQINYPRGMADAYGLMGILAYYTSELDSAEYYHLKALPIWVELKDSAELGKTHIDLGNTAADKGNLNKAIKLYLIAQPYLVASKSTRQLANLYVNIGSIFHEQENYDKALEYYFKGVALKDSMAPNGVAAVYNNISLVYKDQGKYQDALAYSFKSLELKKTLNYERGIAASLTTIGSIYLKLVQPEEAAKYYDEAIKLYRTTGDKYGLGSALGGKGEVYMSVGDYEKAKALYLEALPLAEEEQLFALLRDMHLSLSDVYVQEGNYQKAFEARKLYEAAKDSVVNEETNERIAELMAEFETTQKEQELLLKEAEIQRQHQINKFQIGGFIGILAFLLVAGGLLFRLTRIRQKAQMEAALAREQKLRFREVIDAQEQERKRIAQDLHDGLGQLLSTARLNVSALEDSLDVNDEEDGKIWRNALELIDESVQEVRNVSHNMMPSALIRLGLVPALREQIGKINHAAKIMVRLETEGMESRLDEAVEITLYRVIQEVLNNAIKHSKANEIVVRITKIKGSLQLSIKDDGMGLDLQLIKHSRGIGWKNIFSRVELINGVIDMISSPGLGTDIQVLVPAA